MMTLESSKPNWCFIYLAEKEHEQSTQSNYPNQKHTNNFLQVENEDSQRYTVLSNGKLYKKDSREWLHKTRNKKQTWISLSDSDTSMDSEIAETGENSNVFSSNSKSPKGSVILQKLLSASCTRCSNQEISSYSPSKLQEQVLHTQHGYVNAHFQIDASEQAMDLDMFQRQKKRRLSSPPTYLVQTSSVSGDALPECDQYVMKDYLRRNCNFEPIKASESDRLLDINYSEFEILTDSESKEIEMPIRFSDKSWGKRALNKEVSSTMDISESWPYTERYCYYNHLQEVSTDSWRDTTSMESSSTTPTPSDDDLLDTSVESSPTEPKRHKSNNSHSISNTTRTWPTTGSRFDTWDSYTSSVNTKLSFSDDEVSQDVQNIKFESDVELSGRNEN